MMSTRNIQLAAVIFCTAVSFLSCERKNVGKDEQVQSADDRSAKHPARPGARAESISNKYFSASTSEILAEIREGETSGLSSELLDQASHKVKTEEDVLEIIEMLDTLDASEAKRSSVLVAAFGALSASGLTSEALGLIEEKFGTGNLRQSVLLAVFAHSKAPILDLVEFAQSLDQEMERNIAFGGISHAISLNVSNIEAKTPEFVNSSSQARESLGSGIAQALVRPGQSNGTANADSIVRAFAHDPSFVSGFSKYATGESLEILWPSFLDSPAQWSAGSREEFLRANSRLQPGATVRKLAGWELASENDIRSATERWLESEPNRASSELLTLEFSNSVSRDNAIIEVVRHAMNHDEIESANRWLERIESDAIRSEAAKLVAE